jgi:inner membrane protein
MGADPGRRFFMDPVTHFTTGALGARALREVFTGRSIALLTITAALIPDIDNFIGLGNPELYLIHHRGITHSFLGGFTIAIALAGIFRLFSRSIPLRKGLVIAYACILCHIFLDLITSYGTQIFAPFDHNRYTLQCAFIVDPIFTLLLAGFWVLSLVSKKRGRNIAVAGLIVVLIYPLLNLGIRAGLERSLAKRLSGEGMACKRVELSPEVLAPFFWKVIVEEDSTYRMAGLRLLEPARPLNFLVFQKADLSLLNELGQRASFFRTFGWFAAYPVMQKSDTPSGSRVTFGDLRFYSTVAWLRDAMGSGRSPFALTAILDRNGKLTGYVYGRATGARLIQRVE